MSSDVTVSAAGYSFQFSSTVLLLSCGFIVALIAVLAVTLSYTRRAALKSAEAADVLIVQLERIGDSLERLVAQNAQIVAVRPASEPARRPDNSPSQRPVPDWAAVERVAKDSAPPPVYPAANPASSAPKPAPAVQQASTAAAPTTSATPAKPGAESGEIGPVSDHVRSLLHSMLGK